MSDYNYNKIKKILLEWIKKDALKFIKKQDKIEISQNNINALIIDLTFDCCLGQIVVSSPIFAPYQFLSFEAVEFNCDSNQLVQSNKMIYFFYDNYKMLKEDVITELETGIKYCSDYIPNYLEEKYLNKLGILILNEKIYYRIVHPNDLDKIDKKLLTMKFKCINIESQYLVLKNDTIVIRVLPEVFSIIN